MRVQRRVGLVVAAVLVFGACGGGGDGDSAENPKKAAPEATTSTSGVTTTTEVAMLGNGGMNAGTYRAQLNARTAQVTIGSGWASTARSDSFDLYRGTQNTATELMSFVSLKGTTSAAFLEKARGDGSVELTNESATELGGVAAKRFDIRIRPDRQRIELFEASGGTYELTAGHQATVWLADANGELLLAIAEGKDDTIEAFRPLATTVVASLELAETTS